MSGRWTVLAVSLGLLGILSGGCVSKEEFDKATAAARRANEQLRQCQAARQTLRAENQKLQADLDQRLRELNERSDYIAKLEANNSDLSGKLLKLQELYRKAANRRPPGVSINILPPRVDAALRALARDNSDLMEYLPGYGMIKLKADLTFAKGSVQVRPDAAAALKKLAEIANSDEAKAFHVYVAGHTDDIPLVRPETIKAHGSNWGLSAHRALAVIKVLAAAGLEQRRMAGVAFSKYHPIAPNAPGNKGNELNRRVEIWIVPPDRFLTVGAAAGTPPPAPEPAGTPAPEK